MEMFEGKVVWFNNAKGFGFLSREGGPDVFCHYSSIQTEGYRTLKEGDPVRFSVVQGDKGPQADNVTRLEADGGTTITAANGDSATSAAIANS